MYILKTLITNNSLRELKKKNKLEKNSLLSNII